MQKTDDFFPFKTTSLSPDMINIPLYPGSKRYVSALSSEYTVRRHYPDQVHGFQD